MSMDGRIHNGNLIIPYGDEFPKAGQNMEIEGPRSGHLLINIMSVGTPEWTKKVSVSVPISFYIKQVIKPNKEDVIKKKIEVSSLKLVEG